MTSPDDSLQPIQILLVEDSPLDAEIVIRGLRRMGMTNPVFHVKDGTSALDYLLRRPPYEDTARFPSPDLVLLDINLPRVDGWEVLDTIRDHPPTASLPVIVMTSTDWDAERVAERGDRLTVNLTKPVELATLVSALRPLRRFSVVLVRRPSE